MLTSEVNYAPYCTSCTAGAECRRVCSSTLDAIIGEYVGPTLQFKTNQLYCIVMPLVLFLPKHSFMHTFNYWYGMSFYPKCNFPLNKKVPIPPLWHLFCVMAAKSCWRGLRCLFIWQGLLSLNRATEDGAAERIHFTRNRPPTHTQKIWEKLKKWGKINLWLPGPICFSLYCSRRRFCVELYVHHGSGSARALKSSELRVVYETNLSSFSPLLNVAILYICVFTVRRAFT